MMSVLKKMCSVLLFAAVCLAVSAAPWTTFGPKRKPVTLLITANYVSPRALAELVQYESGQPYLLLPAVDDADRTIFFCPRDSKNSISVPEAHLNRFINMLGVKRIIVLGNSNYIPQKYVDMLDHNTPVMRVEGNDWYRIAEELNFMLNLSNLDKNFERIRERLVTDGRLYRPLRSKQVPENAGNASVPAPASAAPEQTPASELPVDKLVDAAAQDSTAVAK